MVAVRTAEVLVLKMKIEFAVYSIDIIIPGPEVTKLFSNSAE